MAEEFNSIETLASAVKTKLDTITEKKKIVALYAFNSTGKTRLSNLITEADSDEIKSLCYNAFLEDMFVWDNENYILSFNRNSWIIKLVIEQGLENDIISNFKDIIQSNIEPAFDFLEGFVTFKLATGDDTSVTNIKISKGEESMFVWSVFYTVLETVINVLNDRVEDRTTGIFNDLQYIVIDDPVSSIDDTKIITMTIKLIETIKLYENNRVQFLVTTHHALFYNIFVNSFKKDKRYNFKPYNLSKDNGLFILSKQDDSPFSYHLFVKKLIQNAITVNGIEKYHFNLFRNLLEKTSNFLGYNSWTECFSGESKQEVIRLLNLYSHSKLADLEPRGLSAEDKDLFQKIFNTFIQDFKWK